MEHIHTLKDIAVLICVRALREHVTFGVNFSDDRRVTHSVSVLFSCFALFYSCFEIVFLLSNNISQTQFDTAQSISFHQSTLLIKTNVFDVGVICQFFLCKRALKLPRKQHLAVAHRLRTHQF